VAQGMSELSRHGIQVAAFALGQPSLDAVFLSLTGHTTQPPSDGQNGSEVPAA
jgi:daunorubicin/doxorubicin transport system ATP-binding protein